MLQHYLRHMSSEMELKGDASTAYALQHSAAHSLHSGLVSARTPPPPPPPPPPGSVVMTDVNCLTLTGHIYSSIQMTAPGLSCPVSGLGSLEQSSSSQQPAAPVCPAGPGDQLQESEWPHRQLSRLAHLVLPCSLQQGLLHSPCYIHTVDACKFCCIVQAGMSTELMCMLLVLHSPILHPKNAGQSMFRRMRSD